MRLVAGAGVTAIFKGGSGQGLDDTLTWDAGLGAITHIQGPGDQDLAVDPNGQDMTISGNLGLGASPLISSGSTLTIREADDPVLTFRRNDSTVSADDSFGGIEWYSEDSDHTTSNIIGSIKAFAEVNLTGNEPAGKIEIRGHDDAQGESPPIVIDRFGNLGVGANPDNNAKMSLIEDELILFNESDEFSAGSKMDPEYSADSSSSFTIDRHNYFDLQDLVAVNDGTGSLTVGDACVFRFDAAAGTHSALDSGTTKTTPGSVDAWMKVNINSTIHYIPAYTSKTT